MLLAAERSQFERNCDDAIGRLSVWPSTRNTQGSSGGISCRASSQRHVNLVDSAWPAGVESRLARLEQHFGREDETVAHHSDARPVAKDFAQAAEKIGTVAGEFLHLLRQGDIEARAEIGDARLIFLVLALLRRQRLLDRRQLVAQGGDLLVEKIDP